MTTDNFQAQKTRTELELDLAIGKVVAAFSSYGNSMTPKDSGRTTKAVMEFDDSLDGIRALFARTPVQIPEGFWLAPNRVTPEMTEAALEVDDLYRMGRDDLPARIFKAMRREAPAAVVTTVIRPAFGADVSEQLQAFETWACSAKGKYVIGDMLKFSSGAHQSSVDGLTYVNDAVEHDWNVWQAAAAQS